MVKQCFFTTSAGNNNSSRAIDVNGKTISITGIVQGNNITDFNNEPISLDAPIGNVVIASLNTCGKQRYYKTAQGARFSVGNDVINCNSSYVTGALSGPTAIDFNGNVINDLNFDNVLFAKLDKCGEQKFIKTAGSQTQVFSFAQQLSISKKRVFLTGTINIPVANDFNNNPNGQTGSVLIVGFNKCGKQIFFKRAGSTNLIGFGLSTIADSSNVYVTGNIIGTNNYDFNGNLIENNKGIFVAKLNNCGEQKFFVTAGGSNLFGNSGFNIIIYNKHLYVTGKTVGNNVTDFNGNIVDVNGGDKVFVAKLDLCGKQKFFKITGGDIDISAVGGKLTANKCGVYVTGTISNDNALDFNGNPVVVNGIINVFVAGLKHNGKQIFFKTYGESGISSFGSIKATEKRVYVVGRFATNTVASPFVAGLTNKGCEKFFIKTNGAGQALDLDVSENNIYVTGSIDQLNATDFEGNNLNLNNLNALFVARLKDTSVHITKHKHNHKCHTTYFSYIKM